MAADCFLQVEEERRHKMRLEERRHSTTFQKPQMALFNVWSYGDFSGTEETVNV
jgi:hypothetical protein